MDAPTPDPPQPELPASGPSTPPEAYRRGFAITQQIPAFILGCTGAGFGALAHDAEVPAGLAAFMSVVLYATPAQVVLVDQIARGVSLWGGAFAVMLTAIRLLPMTVTLIPYLRTEGVRPWQYVLAAHFVAITGWTEGFRRLPALPERLRMPYFLGMGTGLVLALLTGTCVGYWLATHVPPLLTSALLFMTPLYFTMSLILNAKQRIDWLALAAGAALGPMFYLAAPGFDLLLTGVVGGTVAFILRAPSRRRWS